MGKGLGPGGRLAFFVVLIYVFLSYSSLIVTKGRDAYNYTAKHKHRGNLA